MKKTRAIVLFLIISAAAYYIIAFLALGRGGSHVYSITAIPVVALGASLILGILSGFRILFPILTGVITIPLPIIFFSLSFSKAALFGGIMAVISLVGMILGTIIYAIVNKSCGVTSRDRRRAYADKPLGKSRSQAFRSEKPIDFSGKQTSEDPEKDYLDDPGSLKEKASENKNEPSERPEYVEYTNEELMRRMRGGGNMNKPVSPSLSKSHDRKFDTQRLSADFQTWFNLPVRKDIRDWPTYDGPSITEKAASKNNAGAQTPDTSSDDSGNGGKL